MNGRAFHQRAAALPAEPEDGRGAKAQRRFATFVWWPRALKLGKFGVKEL
jgi:hypothetical protein